MRRIIILTITALLTMLALYGCSDDKNAEIIGKWTPTTAVINGTTVQYSSLELDNDSFELCFLEDGKCSITSVGITEEGTYVFNDTSIDVTLKTSSLKLDYSNSTITLTLNNETNPMSISFVRTIE